MDRQGLSMQSAIGGAILLMLAAVIVFGVYMKLFGGGTQVFSEAECQASLQLSRAVDSAQPVWCNIKAASPIPVQCTTRFINVNDKTVTSYVGKEKDVTREYACTADAQQSCLPAKVFAEEMSKCWHTFFQGQTPVFQQTQDPKFWKDTTESRACFVCSQIMLDTSEDVTDFTMYLKNNQGTIGNYYSYLTNKKAYCAEDLRNPDCWTGIAQKEPRIEQNTFPKNKMYAVVFMRRGLGSCEDKKNPGEGSLTNTVQIIPVDQISTQCTTVIV